VRYPSGTGFTAFDIGFSFWVFRGGGPRFTEE
jgi:hypothetical protein